MTIDKNIPLPPIGGHRRLIPWEEFKVGDSMFFPNYVQSSSQIRSAKETIFNPMNGSRKLPGTKWSTRLVTENGVRGIRLWRTA